MDLFLINLSMMMICTTKLHTHINQYTKLLSLQLLACTWNAHYTRTKIGGKQPNSILWDPSILHHTACWSPLRVLSIFLYSLSFHHHPVQRTLSYYPFWKYYGVKTSRKCRNWDRYWRRWVRFRRHSSIFNSRRGLQYYNRCHVGKGRQTVRETFFLRVRRSTFGRNTAVQCAQNEDKLAAVRCGGRCCGSKMIKSSSGWIRMVMRLTQSRYIGCSGSM